MSTPVAPRQLVVKSRRTNMYTPLSPNSKLTGMGGRPRARDKMWTLQLWVWGRGVRGKCIMQLSLLSYRIVLPPWVRALFVRAASCLDVVTGLAGVNVHVCAHALKRALVHASAFTQARNHMSTCAYMELRGTRSTTAGQPWGQSTGQPCDNPRDSPWDNRGTTHGTAMGEPNEE